ncbi:MAG: DUF3524 domain-containing protein, partial [Phycisphaerae bacterium]
MKILLLSPYHSGSHRAWSEGVQRFSSHSVEIDTLPGRFWKWRMHGAAVTFARRLQQRLSSGEAPPDLVLADAMLDLSTFAALTRRQLADTPLALYLHENQLTYPLPNDPTTGAMRRQHNERDRHYVFINFSSMLTADHIFFNSQFHLESWFAALPQYLNHFPDYRERSAVDRLREKASVLPVGIDLARLQRNAPASPARDDHDPLVLWNQRWEYDKNPEAFFAALRRLAARDVRFRVALCGENFSQKPAVFDRAAQELGSRIIHLGHAEPAVYCALLWDADITVSTAIHEFFGISVLEAMYCETFALLPRRLSYPELVPSHLHSSCLYEDEADLDNKLDNVIRNSAARRAVAREMS